MRTSIVLLRPKKIVDFDDPNLTGQLNRFLGFFARWAPRLAQDHSQASYFGGRKPADGEIDWRWPAKRVYDLVRAVPFGEGCIDYHAFFRGLRDGGFDGVAAYEMCSPLRGGGELQNLDRCASQFLRWMRAHVSAGQ